MNILTNVISFKQKNKVIQNNDLVLPAKITKI